MFFYVDGSKCTHDGLCATVCPARIISFNQEAPAPVPFVRAEDKARCIACGHCASFCPNSAISLTFPYADKLMAPKQKVARDLLPTREEAVHLCKSRRSIRAFRATEVPMDDILELMDAVRYAPNGGNRQKLRWAVLRGRDKLRELGDAMAEWMETGEGRGGGERGRQTAERWRGGEDVYFRGAPCLLAAIAPQDWSWPEVDAAIALTWFDLLALTYDLGTCWGGYVIWASAASGKVRRIVGVDDNEVMGGCMMVGYPFLWPTSIPDRRPLNITCVE